MPYKILFVITGLGRGGAETQLTQLALRLKARGWEVKVVSIMPPQAYEEVLRAADIPVVSLGVRSKWPDLRPVFRLIREIRQWRPQVIHSFMFHANLLARLVQSWVSVPVLLCSIRTFHEGNLREWLYRWTDRLCTLTTHVSQEGMRHYVNSRTVPAHKMVYLPNGVDTTLFHSDNDFYLRQRATLGFQKDHFLWLAVGRLVPAKNYFLLLQAFAQVSIEFPSAYLWIAGEGRERARIEDMAKELGVQRRVSLLGIRTDVPDLMRVADAFVLSSAWEGMPNVVLEAAASGLPVISTRVSGVGDIVLDGETGYLVPPKDSKALAQAMLRLMRLPEPVRRQMGQKARAHVREHFDIEHIVDRWEDLYRRLLHKRGIFL